MIVLKEQDYTINICTDIIEWAKEFYGMQEGYELANEAEVSSECMGFAQLDEKLIWIFVPVKYDINDLKYTIAHEVGHIIEFKFPTNPSTTDENDVIHELKADFYMNYYFLVDKIVSEVCGILECELTKSEVEPINDRPLMTKNMDGDKCPKCGSEEVSAMTPKTVYACGSSDYDQRPNTFNQSDQCKKEELKNVPQPTTTIFPTTDAQIRAYALLQLMAKAEMAQPSSYGPENDLRKRNLADWKKEYYSLIGNNSDQKKKNEPQPDVTSSSSDRGCCMSCTHWRYTQNGTGKCKILKNYTDEAFYCQSYDRKD